MSDKVWWGSSDGRIELLIDREDAARGSHPGHCDDDIAELRRAPYIKEQLNKLDHKDVANELRGYGAWDEDELADEEASLNRLLWLACGSIVDGQFDEE